MAEVQTSTQSGELSQRFIEFVMMHAQNAALFLGQIPNPKTGEGEVNLDLARMFIDQLAMIQEKTRGNLTNEESTVLRNALSNLQMVYVEVARETPKVAAEPATAKPEPTEQPAPEQKPSPPPAASSETAPPVTSTESESESKKKFTKSYGP
jgi:outer membrane biosynthesis protein TonB